MDGRSGLYSVGVLLVELCGGRLPCEQETIKELLAAHATETPPSFRDLGTGQAIPPALEAVVRACLAKSPASRPQSAAELNDRFQAALGRPRSTEANSTPAPGSISVEPRINH